MRKAFCDACGKELGEFCPTIEIPCHIAEKGRHGYVTAERDESGAVTEMIPTSGRMVRFDLCPKCCNKAYEGAMQAVGLEAR